MKTRSDAGRRAALSTWRRASMVMWRKPASLGGRTGFRSATRFVHPDLMSSDFLLRGSSGAPRRLNAVNPQAYLAEVITRIVDGHPRIRLDETLP